MLKTYCNLLKQVYQINLQQKKNLKMHNKIDKLRIKDSKKIMKINLQKINEQAMLINYLIISSKFSLIDKVYIYTS